MSADIHQVGGFYEATQQQLKAMNAMWSLDQYQPGYGQTVKPEQMPMNPGHAAFPHPFANFAHQLTSITSMSSSTSSSPSDTPNPSTKKKPNPVPMEQKDEAYFERRRRNNESARKSREARRYKEEASHGAMQRLTYENQYLRSEVARLRSELEGLKYLTAHNMMHQNIMPQ